MFARFWVIMMALHRFLPMLRAWVMALAVFAMLLLNVLRSQAAEPEFLVTVEGPDPRRDCTYAHNVINLARKAPTATRCEQASDARGIEAARASRRFKYRFALERRSDGSVGVAVENWARVDETDFERLAWNVAPSGDQDLAVQRLAEGVFDYERNERRIKDVVLAKGVQAESSRVAVDAEGRYVDRRTSRPIELETAYEKFSNEGPRQRSYLRAAIEVAATLGLGAIWYWVEADVNAQDWDFTGEQAWRKRFLSSDGYRFDNNTMWLNSPAHPITGALFYLFGRTNGFTSLESFLIGLAASAVWEYVIEYREVVSLNDMVFTPVGGFAIGEAMYQLGEFFARSQDSFVNRVLATIFGGPARFNQWLGKNAPPRSGNIDRFGFTTDVWHQFNVFTGAGYVTSSAGGSSAVASFGFDTQIFNLGAYGRPGDVSRFLSDTAFTQMLVSGTAGERGLVDFLFFTKVAFAGYYRQSIERAESGDLRGYSFFVGPATAFQHRVHESPSGNDDVMGIVNVLGTTLDFTYYAGPVRVRATFDVYGDFAAVRSYAIDRYDADHILLGTKSVLQFQRYYFAFGVTAAPRLVVNAWGFEAGAELTYHHFDSIEGLDRYQSVVTDDFHLRDSLLSYRLWLAYTLPGDWLKLALSFQQIHRRGEIGELTVSEVETQVLASLVFAF